MQRRAGPRNLVVGAACLLALGACAEEPAEQPAAAPGSQVALPSGAWVVTETFPSGGAAAQLIGHQARFEQNEAVTPSGDSCPHPDYQGGLTPDGDFLGAVKTMTVHCDGRELGTYALWPDGSLMARVDGSILRLVPAESAAAAPAKPIEEPKPATEEAKPAAEPPPAPPPAAEAGAATRLYLASYFGEKTAKTGWALLAKESPTLAKLQPAMDKVDLGKKGHFLRLYALTHGPDESKQVCSELKAMLPECGKGPTRPDPAS